MPINFDEGNLFIEIALAENKLNEQSANFCKIQLNNGIEPSVTALTENFMDKDDITKIYKIMNEKLNHKNADIIVLEIDKQENAEDDFEDKLLNYIKENKLLDDKKIQFCLNEQKRLAKMGYKVELSTVFYSANVLKKEKVLAIYKIISGNDVACFKTEVPFSQVGLPKMRKFKKPKKEIPTDVAMFEQISEITKKMGEQETSIISGKKDIKQTELKKSEEKIKEEIQISKPGEIEMESTQTPVEQQIQPSTQLNEILSILHSLKEQEVLEKSSVQKSSEKEEEADFKEMDSEGDKVEVVDFKQGKVEITCDKAIKSIKRGNILDGLYIKELKLSGIKFKKEVSLVNCVVEKVDFSNAEFCEKVNLEGTCFIDKANFKESLFSNEACFKKTCFVNGADFTKAQFNEDTRFNNSGFKRFASFNRAKFAKKAIFSRSYFAKGVKFNQVEFGGNASFNDMYCDHRFYMDKCKFLQESTFSNSKFSDIADFGRSEFHKQIKFKSTNFAKWASFQSAKFKNECHFNGADIGANLFFGWAHFENIINLSAISVQRNINFKNAIIGNEACFKFINAYFGRLFITKEQLENHLESHLIGDFKTARQEYGLLKNNFREINEYDQEDWAYLFEKRMARLGNKVTGPISALKRFFDWTALDISCGYATKPLNIFFTALTMLMFFAIFYFCFGQEFVPPKGIKTSMEFMDAVQVSFSMFANASVGTWEAHASSWINYIMMLESFLGLFIMTVLIVTFSRKVIR